MNANCSCATPGTPSDACAHLVSHVNSTAKWSHVVGMLCSRLRPWLVVSSKALLITLIRMKRLTTHREGAPCGVRRHSLEAERFLGSGPAFAVVSEVVITK